MQRLQISAGCADTEINFLYDSDGDGSVETNGDDEYNNPNAPADGRCDVFSPNGGGLTYIPPPTILRDQSELTGTNLLTSDALLIEARNQIDGAGLTGTFGPTNDLLFMVSYLTPEACDQINRSLGVTGTNTQDTSVVLPRDPGDGFAGVYPGPDPIAREILLDESIGADLNGQLTGCVEETTTGTAGLHFFHVLIAR